MEQKKHKAKAKAKAELPLDLLFQELLPWLPVKSLLRFMSVSKAWLSFIKTPEFATMQMNKNSHHPHKQKLLQVTYPDQHTVFLTIDYEEKTVGVVRRSFTLEYARWVLLLCSCNGMVFIAIGALDRYRKASCPDLVLWNPSTGYHKKFQSMPGFNINCYYKHAFGFYYEEGVNDYKIVDASYNGEAYIYSLKSKSWRTIKGVDGGRFMLSSTAVTCNGHLYWTVRVWQYSYNTMLLSFDLKNEKFVKMPLTIMGNDQPCDTRLATHEERLHVFICYDGCKKIEVWRINVNKKQVLEKMSTLNFRLYCEPICFTSDGKVVVIQLEGRKLVLYDPVNHSTTEHVTQTGCVELAIGNRMGIKYEETLVSPNEIG